MLHLVELSAGPVEGGEQVAGGDRGQADRVHGHHGKVWTFASLLDYQMFCCISFSLILEMGWILLHFILSSTAQNIICYNIYLNCVVSKIHLFLLQNQCLRN